MRPEILASLLLLGSAFAVGWWRLRRRSRGRRAVVRLVAGECGVASLAIALLSPLDRLAEARFSAHMGQHMLLIMVAPALCLLADPLPTVLWALPKACRTGIARFLAAGARTRAVWRALTWTAAAWLVSTLALWLWHLPALYDAALSEPVVHELEHVTLFGAGVLFWWPIINPPPRLHGHVPYSVRVVYLFLAGGQQALLGLLLTMSGTVLYSSYAMRPLAGSSPLEDQARGGILMWATTCLIGLATLMVLIHRLLAREEDALPLERGALGAR